VTRARYRAAVFDLEFFSGPNWHEKISSFSADQNELPLRVVICTSNGSRYDVQKFTLSDLGLHLFPRSGDTMVFLPFQQIAQVEVSSILDRREAGFSAE
jgi:hypothetical protein